MWMLDSTSCHIGNSGELMDYGGGALSLGWKVRQPGWGVKAPEECTGPQTRVTNCPSDFETGFFSLGLSFPICQMKVWD